MLCQEAANRRTHPSLRGLHADIFFSIGTAHIDGGVGETHVGQHLFACREMELADSRLLVNFANISLVYSAAGEDDDSVSRLVV